MGPCRNYIIDGDHVKRMDYCLMVLMKSERGPEPTSPTAVVLPTNLKRDRPRETQTKVVTKKKGPVRFAK